MKNKTAFLFLTLVLGACSTITSTPEPLSNQNLKETPSALPENDPVIDLSTERPTGPKIIVTVGTPHIDQGPNGKFPVTQQSFDTCAFSWANSSLEELTDIFGAAIKKLDVQASAHASAFGEDCIYSDGHKVFYAIETDFYIELPVSNLNDFESFGNWITQIMSIVDGLPPDLIEGPQTGFVEYEFTKSENERLIVRVSIENFKELANGKTGEELFRMFYSE